MPKYPILKSHELIRVLRILEFTEIRQKVSHKQFRNNVGKTTTVPVHGSRDISPILLKQILKEIDIELETFKNYL